MVRKEKSLIALLVQPSGTTCLGLETTNLTHEVEDTLDFIGESFFLALLS